MATNTMNQQFHTYLRDGLLYLPDDALVALSDAGVSPQITETMRQGMRMSDPLDLALVENAWMALLDKLSGSSLNTSASVC